MVERREFEVGPSPHVRVERVRGDLGVIGEDSDRLNVQGGPDGAPKVEHNDALIVIQAQQSLRLRVPQGATLEVGHIGGDLQIEGVRGEIHLGKVGGDTSLKKCGGVVADRVGGDVLARQVSAALSIKAVGGDVLLDGSEAGLEVLGAGGDASLRELPGPIDAAVGGDVHLILGGALRGNIDLQVGGDVFCRLPNGASARVELSAGGDLQVDPPIEGEAELGGLSFELGAGEHDVRIDAGGDLWMGVGEEAEADVDLESLGSTLASKVGEKIAEMEAALSAMGAEMGAVSGERIAERVQRIVDRAVRDKGPRSMPRGLKEALEGLGSRPRAEPVTDEERLKILQMLEQKKISVEEAEQLLEALEN